MNERGGSCFPSIVTLSKETSLSERSVRYSIGVLVESGWLEKRQGGGSRSNTYMALTPARVAPLQQMPPATVSDTPATDAPTPAPVAAESVIESVIEDEKNDVRVVYDYWRDKRSRTHGRYGSITKARRDKIAARLKDGYTVEDLCRAIDAVALDDWDGRSRNDDIVQLFRSPEKVDRWLELVAKPSAGVSPDAECPECGLRFAGQRTLAQHISNIHQVAA
jgi:uncharacterized phage protein (TIGR02220 family)